MLQSGNKITQLITILALFITVGLMVSSMIPPNIIIFFFPFGLLYKGYFDLFLLLISFLIFLRANYLYSKTLNPKMAIIAGGFLSGAIIYVQQHDLFCNICQIYKPQFNLLIAVLTWSLTLFTVVFFSLKDQKTPINFRRTVYIFFFLYTIGISVLDRFISYYFVDYIYKIIINIPFLNIAAQAIYLLTSYTYMDMKRTEKSAVLSNFNLGLLWLGIVPLFTYSLFGTTLFAFISPVIRFIGFIFILTGLNDISEKQNYMGFRQKFTAYLLIFLITSYVIIISISSIILDIKFPLFFQYIFFGFFILITIIQYIISNIFIRPLFNITNGIKRYSPEKEPEKIPINSNDEIGDLTEKINYILDLNWNHTQELLVKQKELIEYANRETLLKNIVEKIRSSLDIDETLTFICDEAAKLFDVQRAAISEFYDINDRGNFIPRREYKKSPDIKGLKEINYLKKTGAYIGEIVLDKGINLVIDNMSESNVPDYFKETYIIMGVKSALCVPIRKGEDKFGTIFLAEYNYYRNWTEDEITLLETVAGQAYIAIKQAELYEKEKQISEKESTLRKTMEVLRSTLDADKIKKYFVEIIGNYFDADRCLFLDYDKETNMMLPFKIEILKPEIKSLAGINPETDFPEFVAKAKKGKDIFIKDLEETLSRKKFIKYKAIETLSQNEVKSGYGLLIKYKDQIVGVLILHFVNKKRILTHDELNFLKVLRNQAATALYQAYLYATVKYTAEKEKLLREIESDIKLSHSLEQVYNYILSKLSQIFDVSRTFFAEIPEFETKKPVIKYEYNTMPSQLPLKNTELPEVCIDTLSGIIETASSVFINDIKTYHPENQDLQNFFDSHNVKSILASPLIKYNKEKIIFGVFVLCSQKLRNWTQEEINLLEEILSSSTSVVWEILKRTEIDELRNTFILTLAHDLEVPLIGERRALEFIMSIPPGQLLDKYKNIIEETIKNNKNISSFLKKLVDSYSYELERKKLYFTETCISDLIHNVINLQKNYAESKSILINVSIQYDLPDIKIDKKEMKKAISTLLENAITYTPEGGKVQVKCNSSKDTALICIIDNGSGIPKEIQKRLFKRYEMAVAIERKIGSGLGLYLAKQIVEAHGGNIWLTSEENIGTTFCFSLPLKRKYNEESDPFNFE
ncbi:MAG: GAF domain-containing sensor histidine kinase [Candidatus Gastranaerophilaceae bacterium]|jgi:signal transduction histidine kinase